MDEPDEGPSFSAEGINTIFRYFEEDYKYPCGVLSAEKATDLSGCVESMRVASDGTFRGWVVYNDEMSFHDDPHVVPVFAIKDHGQVHVFIFDSVGHDTAGGSYSVALEKLTGSGLDPKDLMIYSYKHKRQHSGYGCSIFSILDLKSLVERHIRGRGNLVNFYQSQEWDHLPRLIEEISDGYTVLEIDVLPPEMMKVTQSYRALDAYGRSSPVLGHVPSFERYTDAWDTEVQPQDMALLQDKVSQICRFDNRTGREKNFYMLKKRFDFIVYLIGLHFKGDSPALPKHPRVARSLFMGGGEESKGALPPLPFPGDVHRVLIPPPPLPEDREVGLPARLAPPVMPALQRADHEPALPELAPLPPIPMPELAGEENLDGR